MAASLAVEWATKGIRVNCISYVSRSGSQTDLRPGYVLTNLTKTILDANTELRDTWVNMTPMVSFSSLTKLTSRAVLPTLKTSRVLSFTLLLTLLHSRPVLISSGFQCCCEIGC